MSRLQFAMVVRFSRTYRFNFRPRAANFDFEIALFKCLNFVIFSHVDVMVHAHMPISLCRNIHRLELTNDQSHPRVKLVGAWLHTCKLEYIIGVPFYKSG